MDFLSLLTVIGIIILCMLAWRIFMPQPYYDYNKVCGQFDDKNLEKDPYFFRPEDYDWVEMVESNWTIIRDELEAYLKHSDLMPYFGSNLMSHDQCWSVLGLEFWGIRNERVRRHFPKTMEIMSRVPGFSLAAFSKIEAGTAIKPHNGDTNANIRCHLGLIIPGELPKIGFTVGTESKSWHEGKILMFCDAHRHTAFNNTDELRIIFQFDVIRPEYAIIRPIICARVLASICAQKFVLHSKTIKSSTFLTRLVYYSFIPFMLVPVFTQFGSQRLFDFFVEKKKEKK